MSYNLLFDTDEPPTPQELTETFVAAIEESGGLMIGGRNFTVDKESVGFTGTHVSIHSLLTTGFPVDMCHPIKGINSVFVPIHRNLTSF